MISAAYLYRAPGWDVDDELERSAFILVINSFLVNRNAFYSNDVCFVFQNRYLSWHRLDVVNDELFSKHLHSNCPVATLNAVAVADSVPKSPPTKVPVQGLELPDELR